MTEGGDTTQKARKRWPLVLGIAVAVAVLAIGLAGRHPERRAALADAPAITVETVTVRLTDVADEVTASGTVRPLVEAKIAPKIMSNVAAVYVSEGDHVRAGQVLLRLESRDLQAQLAQARAGLSAASAGSSRAYTAVDLQKAQTSTGMASAEANLNAAQEQLALVKAGPRKQQRAQAHFAVAQAEAQFKNAEAQLNRYKKMEAQGAISKQQLDAEQTLYDVAKAQLDWAKEQASLTEEGSRTEEIRTAEQQVRQAQEALRMARAAAVQDKMSVSNAHVAASQVSQARAAVEYAQTQLGYAVILSPISGVVSQRMVDPGDTVSPGVPVVAVQADSKYRLEATVPSSSAAILHVGKAVNVSIGADGRTATGRVSVISPAGDPTSHKFVVKVELPASLRARSGEFGRMSFTIGYSDGVVVPEAALRDQGGLPAVFVVDADGHARMQAVKVGRRTDNGIEILSGLSDGDRVIVGNRGVLEDGVPVKVGVL